LRVERLQYSAWGRKPRKGGGENKEETVEKLMLQRMRCRREFYEATGVTLAKAGVNQTEIFPACRQN